MFASVFYRGRVSPPRRRVSFWTAKKKPKSRQGAVQMDASRPYSRSPGPPFTGAANAGTWRSTQRRGWTSIGVRSITAAAEGPATFGYFSSWWRARLWSGWGSSAAQRDGVSGDDFRSPQGRPSVPPTVPRLRKPPCRAADGRPFPLHRKPVTAHGTRPPGFAPKTMARQTQAQKLNGSGNDFLPI